MLPVVAPARNSAGFSSVRMGSRDVFDPSIASDGSFNLRVDKLAEALAAEATLDTDGNGIPQGREALIERCLKDNEPVFMVGSLRNNPDNLFTTCLEKVFWYPWTHIVGGTLTYNDDRFTGLVFRLEESFSTREPRNGVRRAKTRREGEKIPASEGLGHVYHGSSVWRFGVPRRILGEQSRHLHPRRKCYWFVPAFKNETSEDAAESEHSARA